MFEYQFTELPKHGYRCIRIDLRHFRDSDRPWDGYIMTQHQSESITFRLDSTILNKLHHEAEQNDISVNTLVSYIIRRHIDWHYNAAKAGFVNVRRGFLIIS
jgi:hypothetical protein